MFEPICGAYRGVRCAAGRAVVRTFTRAPAAKIPFQTRVGQADCSVRFGGRRRYVSAFRTQMKAARMDDCETKVLNVGRPARV